ncbi:aldo/keto reductase [Alphaproteobacteria bacterium]|nr:aldo/keto reductase [Alphaproteobacteria bacterium]
MVKKIGFSAYDKDEIISVTNNFSIDCVQLPLSLLDQRLAQNEFLPWLKSQNLEIEARSVFLQGALLMPTNQLPMCLAEARNVIEKIKSDQSKRGVSVLDACIDFVKSIGCIDRMVVGVHSVQQLRQILEANNKTLARFDYSAYAIDDEKIVNPTKWPS